MSSDYNEDNLVESAASEIFKRIGWEVRRAYKDEQFGLNSTFGRENKSQIILAKYLIPSLKKLNPGLPETVYRDAYNIIKDRTIDTKIDKINK